ETPSGQSFLNVTVPPVRLIVTGAVHISQALAPMARLAGFDVTIIDPRTAFATPERFPDIDLRGEWPDAVLPQLGLDRYTAVAAVGAIAAHSVRSDGVALKKGETISAEKAEAIAARGVARLTVARLAPGDRNENDLAHELALKAAGANIRVAEPFTGRANLF